MNLKEFLLDNYIYILAVILLSIVTIIGFLVDKSKSKKEKKEEVKREGNLASSNDSVVNQPVLNNMISSEPNAMGLNQTNATLMNNTINQTETVPTIVNYANGMSQNVMNNQVNSEENNQIPANQPVINNIPNTNEMYNQFTNPVNTNLQGTMLNQPISLTEQNQYGTASPVIQQANINDSNNQTYMTGNSYASSVSPGKPVMEQQPTNINNMNTIPNNNANNMMYQQQTQSDMQVNNQNNMYNNMANLQQPSVNSQSMTYPNMTNQTIPSPMPYQGMPNTTEPSPLTPPQPVNPQPINFVYGPQNPNQNI